MKFLTLLILPVSLAWSFSAFADDTCARLIEALSAPTHTERIAGSSAEAQTTWPLPFAKGEAQTEANVLRFLSARGVPAHAEKSDLHLIVIDPLERVDAGDKVPWLSRLATEMHNPDFPHRLAFEISGRWPTARYIGGRRLLILPLAAFVSEEPPSLALHEFMHYAHGMNKFLAQASLPIDRKILPRIVVRSPRAFVPVPARGPISTEKAQFANEDYGGEKLHPLEEVDCIVVQLSVLFSDLNSEVALLEAMRPQVDGVRLRNAIALFGYFSRMKEYVHLFHEHDRPLLEEGRLARGRIDSDGDLVLSLKDKSTLAFDPREMRAWLRAAPNDRDSELIPRLMDAEIQHLDQQLAWARNYGEGMKALTARLSQLARE